MQLKNLKLRIYGSWHKIKQQLHSEQQIESWSTQISTQKQQLTIFLVSHKLIRILTQ